ncbi:MAG: 2-hydroxyacid dehydrogenase, partial [Cytophagales bacterium]|nr:2-hydroxyacid dehydrogenase [Cytophagales bacterium]
MKVAIFSSKHYEKEFLEHANAVHHHELTFFEFPLNHATVHVTKGFDAICVFVNDVVDKHVVTQLASYNIKLIALRCAGFNNVDLVTAKSLGISVVRVPAYSPYSVAEHTVALMLTLNRKIHKAYNRVKEGNFSLEGLVGFDMHGKTVGLIGTGKIGKITAQILNGFGCHLLGYDIFQDEDCKKLGLKYTSLDEIYAQSDIISLHCPLTPETKHLIDAVSLKKMKKGVMLVNTSRGALIDTKAVIKSLKSGHIGYLALDVYEEEADLFFEDLSSQIITDDNKGVRTLPVMDVT